MTGPQPGQQQEQQTRSDGSGTHGEATANDKRRLCVCVCERGIELAERCQQHILHRQPITVLFKIFISC